ncbi:MAG: STAS domain-containing protein [Schwartzia sp.]|nr:STAS domain-containing protein [Schwartzia sp. (in: firmicutes)]
MDIKQETNGTELTMFLSGRLDAVAAVDFEKALDAVSKDVTLLIVDCAELSYVASSGLRMFLRAQKRMNAQGKLVVRHVQESVMEVFSMTGFDSLLQIEN